VRLSRPRLQVSCDCLARRSVRGAFLDQPLDQSKEQSAQDATMSDELISMEVYSTLAIAMNRLHDKLNTGEGAKRSNVLLDGDTMRSATR
jgi:hypothetical protein